MIQFLIKTLGAAVIIDKLLTILHNKIHLVLSVGVCSFYGSAIGREEGLQIDLQVLILAERFG